MIELDFNIQDVFAASFVHNDVVFTFDLEVGAQSFWRLVVTTFIWL